MEQSHIEQYWIGRTLCITKFGPNSDTATFDQWQTFIDQEAAEEDVVFNLNVVSTTRHNETDPAFWEILFDAEPSDDDKTVISRCLVSYFNSLHLQL